MKRIFWFLVGVLIIIIFAFATAQAGSLDLRWDAVTGATGYKIYQSIDGGTVWSAGTDVGNITQSMVTVVDTSLILFKVSAYATSGESIRQWSGAWYDGRKKPILTPGGTGIQ